AYTSEVDAADGDAVGCWSCAAARRDGTDRRINAAEQKATRRRILARMVTRRDALAAVWRACENAPMHTLKTTVILVALAIASLSAGQRPAVRPPSPHRSAVSDGGFSPERLARLDRVLQEYVDENRVAGVVALVLRDGQPAYERAFGWSDKEAGRRMSMDTIFRSPRRPKPLPVSRSCRSWKTARSVCPIL